MTEKDPAPPQEPPWRWTWKTTLVVLALIVSFPIIQIWMTDIRNPRRAARGLELMDPFDPVPYLIGGAFLVAIGVGWYAREALRKRQATKARR